MKRYKAVLAISLMAMSTGSVFAQTCANPIPLTMRKTPYSNAYTGASDARTSCDGQNNIDLYDAQGIFSTPGNDVVYKVTTDSTSRTAPIPSIRFTLQEFSNFYDGALFACSQCSDMPTCFGVADEKGMHWPEIMDVPAQPKSYYVMVDSKANPMPFGCGPYALYAEPKN